MAIVKISDFLTRIKKPIDIKDDEEYKRITIKINHQGVLLRDVQKGHLIGTKKQFIVKKGQFILSKIDAMNGAFGIVSDDLDEAIITGNFWTFDFNKSKVFLDWFNYFTSSDEFVDICKKASSGTTHRKYLDENKFNNYELELPSIDSQKKVVEKIKSVLIYQGKIKKEIDEQIKTISSLKQSILQDAIQGKLVPQDPNDEPAGKLLEKIKAEKEKLIKEGKLKKDKPLPPVKLEEIPFELPKKWSFCRIGDVSQINPRNNVEKEIIASFIPMSLISSSFGITPRYEEKTWSEIKKGFTHFAENDIVVAKITPCFENSKAGIMKNLVNKIGAGTTELHVIRSFCNDLLLPEYIYLVIKSSKFLDNGEKKMTGSAGQKRVPSEYVRNYIFGIPPLNEQKKIVEKVNALMNNCDEQEKNINEAKDNINKLNQAILREMFN